MYILIQLYYVASVSLDTKLDVNIVKSGCKLIQMLAVQSDSAVFQNQIPRGDLSSLLQEGQLGWTVCVCLYNLSSTSSSSSEKAMH